MTEATPPPHTMAMRYHCDQGHDSTEYWAAPMVLSEFARRLKAAICPACGSKKIFMGHAKAEVAAP